MCPPPPFKKGDQILKMSKGGDLKKNLGRGKPKAGKKISKWKGGTQLFKLNLRIKKGKDGDFQRQIIINFFKRLTLAAKDPSSLDIYYAYNQKVFLQWYLQTQEYFKFSAQKVSENFGCKRRGTNLFMFGVGKKRGGEPKFSQSPTGGSKALHTMEKLDESLISK